MDIMYSSALVCRHVGSTGILQKKARLDEGSATPCKIPWKS